MFSRPHISQPYVIMGTTIWLNSLRRTSRGKNKHLALRSKENIALLPFSYNFCFAFVLDTLILSFHSAQY